MGAVTTPVDGMSDDAMMKATTPIIDEFNSLEEAEYANAHINVLSIEDLQEIQDKKVSIIENGCETVLRNAEDLNNKYVDLYDENL